jgi:CheY-like chemotaxis protein
MAHELILVVDDDRIGLTLTRMILLAAGFMVITAQDAEAALDLLADPNAEIPAVIVLDLELPKMSGLDLARRLRQVGCPVPIIAYTAHGTHDWKFPQQAYAAGCNGFVEKTGNIENLPRLLRQWVPTEPVDAPTAEPGPLVMATAEGTH